MLWTLVSLLGQVAITAWTFLLAYRIVGKRPGEDPAYDKRIDFLSGTLKVMGALGVLTIIFSLVDLVIFRK
jgi:hypothetical protein